MYLLRNIFFIGIIFLTACSYQEVATKEQQHEAARLIIKGTQQMDASDYPAAEAAFLLALDIVPNAPALDGLGSIAHRQRNYEKALEYYISANRFDPEYVGVLGNLALLYHELGEPELAKTYYLRALKKNPKNFKFHNNFSALSFDYLSREASNLHASWQSINKAMNLTEDKVVKDNYMTFKQQLKQ